MGPGELPRRPKCRTRRRCTPDRRRTCTSKERFVICDLTQGIGAGWAWAVRYNRPRQGGWISPHLVAETGESVYLCRAPTGILEPQNEVCEYIPPSVSVPSNLSRMAPDGTDLRGYSNLGVCFSVGSRTFMRAVADMTGRVWFADMAVFPLTGSSCRGSSFP